MMLDTPSAKPSALAVRVPGLTATAAATQTLPAEASLRFPVHSASAAAQPEQAGVQCQPPSASVGDSTTQYEPESAAVQASSGTHPQQRLSDQPDIVYSPSAAVEAAALQQLPSRWATPCSDAHRVPTPDLLECTYASTPESRHCTTLAAYPMHSNAAQLTLAMLQDYSCGAGLSWSGVFEQQLLQHLRDPGGCSPA